MSSTNPTTTVYSQGGKTLSIPRSVHQQHREKLCKSFLEAYPDVAQDKGAVIVLKGASDSHIHDTDIDHVFRQEANFHYLFGVKEPDFYGLIEINTAKSVLFAPKLPDEYAIWMGTLKQQEHFKAEYLVDEVQWVDDLSKYLGNYSSAYTLHGINADSGRATTTQFTKDDCKGCDQLKIDNERLFEVLNECRVIKNDVEMAIMRYVCAISSEAHNEVLRRARPGMAEYQLEAMFKYFCYFYGGCRHGGYTCICGSGPNAAVLHYGHAGAPNDRTFKDGDIMMLDMGGEYYCYDADISCSWPANGKFTDKQRIIYEAVRCSQQAVFDAMKPGVNWVDMHMLSERVILEHLQKAGVVRADADIDEAVKARLGAILMPHGLGHMLGLETHDVGGYPKDGPKRRSEPGLKSLRTARTLKKGMVLTVEPGCYFIDHLMDKALADPELKKFLNAEKFEEFRGFGGIRLEDDVAVTENGIENFTKCPRTIEGVEKLMAEGRKLYGDNPEIPGELPKQSCLKSLPTDI